MPYDEEIPPYGDLAQPSEEINELAHRVIGVCIDVHRELGPGLPEEAYENGLVLAFGDCGISFERQYRIVINYKGRPVCAVRLDFLIEGKLVLEVKACEALGPIDRKQVTRYLQVTRLALGLLVNFNVMALKDGLLRIFRKESLT